MVLLVDMPGVTPSAVRRIAALAGPDALAMGGYAGRRGHPVLLGRDHWAGVAAAPPVTAAPATTCAPHADLVRVVDVGDVADDADLDVPSGVSHA